MGALTRQPDAGDMPALRHIWKTVFAGDDDEVFFDMLYDPGMCVAAWHGGALAAAGYLLPTGRFVCGGNSYPCAMIYAVATLPGYRGLGFGSAITRSLISLGRAAGYPAIVLRPATDSLFEYYSKRTEMKDWFYAVERRFEKPPGATSTPASGYENRWAEKEGVEPSQASIPKRGHGTGPGKIGVKEYIRLRESLLGGLPHIEPDQLIVEYQGLLCRKYGGGLYKAETPGGTSCAVVEPDRDGTVWIKELLAPGGGEDDALAAILSAFPAKSYIVRTPARLNDSGPQLAAQPQDSSAFRVPHSATSGFARFGMLAAPRALFSSENAEKAAPWYGLALD